MSMYFTLGEEEFIGQTFEKYKEEMSEEEKDLAHLIVQKFVSSRLRLRANMRRYSRKKRDQLKEEERTVVHVVPDR